MTKLAKVVAPIVLFLCSAQGYAFYKLPGHLLIEGGSFGIYQGYNQTIAMQGLEGDRYNATNRYDNNAVFGLAYIVDGYQNNKFKIDYGVNAFYLSQTTVSGVIAQEQMFTNLAYNYKVNHLPVYALAKALINTPSDIVSITLDAGVGPNFMKTSHYNDWSLDGGVTQPDNAFTGHSSVEWSAMAGIGLKLNPHGQLPIELGYRFFYLGQGHLTPRTNQILNNLKTGPIYANSLMLTLSI